MTVPILKRRNLLGASALFAAVGFARTGTAAPTIPSQTAPTVFNFGAVGDGATDDSAAFSAALQWSAANSRMVVVPPCSYAVANSITFQSTQNVGSNWGLACQGAQLISKITNGAD